MKILMIAPEPFFQPRGTPFSILHRLKALSSFGYHVDMVTYHLGEEISIEKVSIKRIISVPFVTSIDIGPSLKKIWCDFFIFFKAVAMLSCKRYDAIHTHEEAGFMGILLKFLFNVPHVYDMHSSLPQQLNNFKRGNIKPLIFLFTLLENITLKTADAIITICPDLQKTVKEVDPGVNSFLIENVGDNSLIFGEESREEKVDDLFEVYNIPRDKKIILYTGTFEKYQGIGLLMEAAQICFKTLDEAVVVLVGGKKEQVDEMREVGKKYGIDKKTIFAGSVHPKMIPSFYEISTIIVSPRKEGTNSPLKLYSYLRSERPILATNCYTHTQILDSEVAHLVDPSPEAFSAGIIALIKDEGYRNQLVRKAKKLAESKYSYKEYLKKTFDLYRSLQKK